MEILKFALGMRFDTLKNSVEDEDVELILSELFKALSVQDVKGLQIYGGTCRLSPRDSAGIYTVVFMNGKLGTMRKLYARLDSDAVLKSMSDHRTPYVQNNVIRNFTDMEYFGEVNEDGRLSGGSGRELRFPEKTEKRAVFTDKNSIIVAPNAFKGTISAETAARHIMAAIRRRLPGAYAVPVPAADGGDGTLSAVESSLVSMRRSMKVNGPYGDPVNADYLVMDGEDAVIESALASGLALCGERHLDPLEATSYGTGELMCRAAHEGVKRIFVCLGGSATNDCGIGLARALGCRILNGQGEEVTSAAQMETAASIDASGMDPFIKKTEITVVCDVDNPLTGRNGATYTFGPQKGADSETLEKLEKGMLNMERLLNAYSASAVCSEKGAGAAGGMGAMLMAVFGAKYVSGAEALLEIAGFDDKLKKASLVITGEGRIDETSLHGKAVGAMIQRAESAGVPVAIIAGCRGEGAELIEKRTAAAEYTGSEEDALRHFDEAAERLIASIAEKIGVYK